MNKCELCGNEAEYFEGERWTGSECKTCGAVTTQKGNAEEQALMNIDSFLATASESEVSKLVDDYANNYVKLRKLAGPGFVAAYERIIAMMKAELHAIRARRDGKNVVRNGFEVVLKKKKTGRGGGPPILDDPETLQRAINDARARIGRGTSTKGACEGVCNDFGLKIKWPALRKHLTKRSKSAG